MIYTGNFSSNSNDTPSAGIRIFRGVVITVSLYLAFFIMAGLATADVGPKKIALVMGNSTYDSAPLANPVNDARLISETLRKLDFEVLEYLDVNQQEMKRSIQTFGDHLDRAGRESVGLFYYAGHGIQVNGGNYLIPVNANIQRERDVEIEAVNVNAVMAVLDYARTQINFVIIDACRNNPFARSFRSANRGLARMDAPQGTLLAFATAPGDVAADGENSNSPYSYALAGALQIPDIPVEQMFKTVRRSVMEQTSNVQVPWESSSLTGNFYFNRTATGEQGEQPFNPAVQANIDKEALFWQTIKDSREPEDFQEYLRQFPAGTFAVLARNRIEALTHNESQIASGQVAPSPIAQTSPEAHPPPETTQPVALSSGEDVKPVMRGVEQEPNNTIGSSNFTSPDSTSRGRINPRGDVDWYSFSIRQQGELTVSILQAAPEMDFVFRIWDYEYRAITNWFAPLRKGGETTGLIDLPAPGKYYLELRDSHDDAGSEQAYQMVMSFLATYDGHEPNNSFGAAADVSAGTSWASTILPRGDVDWYRFNFASHGELQITVSHVPAELDISFRLWNANKRAITPWYAPLKQGGDTIGRIDIPQPGIYLLEVRDGRDDNRSGQPFTTTAAFIPSQDRYEPNDSFGQAVPLAIGETVKGTILPRGDVDWFSISADEQGELKIQVNNVPEDLDISFRLWDGELRAITNWFAPLKPGGDTNGVIDLPGQGSYLLEVRDGSDDNRSVSSYSLRATFTPTRDRGEPNNSFGTAVPLKTGSTATGTILPKGDADWFHISLGSSGTLVVRITDSPENLDMSMRVWNNERRAVSNWITPLKAGGESQGEVAIPKAGSYFIEVRDGRDDNRSVLPYRLTTRLK